MRTDRRSSLHAREIWYLGVGYPGVYLILQIPYSQIPYPLVYPTPKGTWDQRYPTPRKDLVPGIPPGQNDRHLWKHYLPLRSLIIWSPVRQMVRESSSRKTCGNWRINLWETEYFWCSVVKLWFLWPLICLDYLLANWETFVHTSTQKIPKRKKSITKEESMNQLLVYFVIQCKIAAKSSEVNILCWREYREFCIKQKKYWIYSCFLFEKETNGKK